LRILTIGFFADSISSGLLAAANNVRLASASLLVIVSPVAAFYNSDDDLKIIVNSVMLQ
jgi:hypothetical protein